MKVNPPLRIGFLAVLAIFLLVGGKTLAATTFTRRDLPNDPSSYPVTSSACNVGVGTTAPLDDILKNNQIEQNIRSLQLNLYHAVNANNLSLCNSIDACSDKARTIIRWFCIADSCSNMQALHPVIVPIAPVLTDTDTGLNTNTDTNINTNTNTNTATSTATGVLVTVLPGSGTSDGPAQSCLSQSGSASATELDDKVCRMISNPNATNRSALFSFMQTMPAASRFTEDALTEYVAYIMAKGGDADACQQYIKTYLGLMTSGSRWNFSWYRALSGCRILANPSESAALVVNEENNFRIWYRIYYGVSGSSQADCTGINNSALRDACTNSSAPSPEPPYTLLP